MSDRDIPVPDWIYPDAPVIVADVAEPKRTFRDTVRRVNKKSFSLSEARGSADRAAIFALDTLKSPFYGSTYHGWQLQVFPPDSEQGLAYLTYADAHRKAQGIFEKVSRAEGVWNARPLSKKATESLIAALEEWKVYVGSNIEALRRPS